MEDNKPIHVLLIGSDLTVKGGIVSVLKNYLAYEHWDSIVFDYVPTHIDGSTAKKSIFFLKSMKKIRSKLKAGEVQLAHVHVSERGSFVRKMQVIRLIKKFKIPVILHHHGAEFEEYYRSASSRTKDRIRRTLGEVDVNLVLSERLKSMIKDKNPRAHVTALPNAVNIAGENRYHVEARNLLLLGELNERKGVYILLEAIKHMDDKLPKDIRLFLCGDGDLGRLKAEIESKGLEHRIAHLGWVNQKGKKEIFSQTMINVLPSYHEGLPMTILETMGYGIPNIATAIASIPDVIHEGETGMLVTPGNPEELEAKLWKMIQNVEVRSSISKNSYEIIRKEYSMDSYVTRLRKLYLDLIKKNRGEHQ